MADTLGVAVLGFWHVHAADYARQAVEHPGTRLVAVWDDDPERGAAGAAQFDVPFEADLATLLARPDIDAVIVTTATTGHADAMLRATAAGKHVFAEKLLAPTVAEAEAIVAAADTHGVKLVVSLPRLYHGSTRAISEIIAAGRLGQLTYGRVRLSHDGAISRPAEAAWLPERFFEPAGAVGGALTDLGCHPVYLIQLFLGAHPDTVSATYRSLTHRPAEDHAVVTVGYPDQQIGVIEAGFVSDNPFSIEIHGTDGSVRYRRDGNRLEVAGAAFGADEFQAIAVPADGPDAFEQWLGHIALDSRADDNLSRAVELTRLVDAANQAAAEGRTIAYG